ncbi:trichodiene oxygenase [Xylariaceae sp. FL0594]|nr:trichodiene oxygenase [Xylariaceae sp. FL0594]
MDLNISWHAIAATVVLYYLTLILYRLSFHPLSQFPGPRLAAISRWYEAYYDIAELHKKYGPIIRISPYELHVNDPAFYDSLYRMDGRWYKYSWTYDAFGAKNSTVFCSDHNVHKIRRSAIGPFFSKARKARITARQDVISRNVEKLCQRISDLAGTDFNLGAAVSAFTRDTANEFIVGKRYEELDLEDFGIALSLASQGAGPFWRITKHMRWFGPAMRALPVPWAMRIADEGTKAFFDVPSQSEKDTRDTLAAATSSSSALMLREDEKPSKSKSTTMIHEIAYSDLPPAEKAFERVFEEVATVTGAAYETTATTLRLIIYHIFTDDEILRTLRKEIETLCGRSKVTLKDLEQFPYLTAVIKEGLRLSPGIGSRAARVTDKEIVYETWRIPAGTPVGMTTLLMHTDENVFRDPMRFHPGRWIEDEGRRRRSFAPFSRGTRMCLGMHLAWAEMYLLLSALVQRFNFTFKDCTGADFMFERDNFNIGTKAGCNLVACSRSV